MVRILRKRNTQKGGNLEDIISIPHTLMTGKDTPGRPGFPGEKHAIFLDGPNKGTKAQFMGPGTRIKERLARGDPGVNDADKVAKQHDIKYSKAGDKYKSKKIDKKQFIEEIKKADEEFIKDIKETKDAPMTSKIAEKAILLKSYAEGLGVLPTAIFSGAGIDCDCPEFKELRCKVLMPDHYLKKEMNKQSGGLAPLAIALISALAPVAVEKLIDLGKFAIKKFKGGALPSDLHRKAGSLLDSMSESKQIELLSKIINKYGKAAFIDQ